MANIKCYGVKNRLFNIFKTRNIFNDSFNKNFPDFKLVDSIWGWKDFQNGLYSVASREKRCMKEYYIVFDNEIYFMFDSFVEYSRDKYITQGASDLRNIKNKYLTKSACEIKEQQVKRAYEYDVNSYKCNLYFEEPAFKTRLKRFKQRKKINEMLHKT
jgi:hypothetical protein